MATITDSWADIKAAIIGGTFAYSVGDTKQFTYGDGTTNHTVDAEVRYIDTTNKFVDFVLKTFDEKKEFTNSNIIKYSESVLKVRLDTIYASELPSDLKTVIIQKNAKYHCYDDTTESVISYLWILNSREVGSSNFLLEDGVRYFSTISQRKRYDASTTNVSDYWTGTIPNSSNPVYVSINGDSINNRGANTNMGLVFGFRIGDTPNTYEIYGDQKTLDKLVAHELTEFKDDRVTELGSHAFYYQQQLVKAKLPSCTSIGASAFANCSALQEIWLGSTVPSVQSTSIPNQFSSGAGAIYVPRSAVANYRANSSWATWKWHVVAQEDYPVTNFDSISDSWTEIATKIQAGTDNYSVGDYKTVDLGTEGKIRMKIAAINVDELSSGGSYAKYSWVAMDLLNTDHRMNPALSGTTEGTGAIGGWGKSEMRAYLSTTIWALIPAELQAVIKEVKKYSCIYDTSSTKVSDDVSNDKLWIPSVHEAFNNTTYETTGPSYTGIFASNSNRKRFKPGASSAADWWERTANNTSGFRQVRNNGGDTNGNANFSLSVLLGFCI